MPLNTLRSKLRCAGCFSEKCKAVTGSSQHEKAVLGTQGSFDCHSDRQLAVAKQQGELYLPQRRCCYGFWGYI